MVKNALFKKSIRDIRRSLAQFICIFVMAMVSVAIVVGIDSIWKTMDVESADMYAVTDLSDLWVSVQNPSAKELWKIEHIDGVERVERRFAVDCSVKLPKNPSLKVYGVKRDSQLDLPYVQAGSWNSKDGCILDSRFAKARGIAIGDRVTLEIGDRWMEFTVEALALSSEHIFSVKDSTTVMPKAEDYGFVVVDADKIKAAYGGYPVYNELSLRLNENTDSALVSEEIDALLGDRMLGVMTHQDARSTRDVAVRVQQLKTLAQVFPIMFFLVTALITLSTMRRLVEDQRGQIGILKALGYGKKAILWHYTSYGVYVGVLGLLGGLLVGPNVIGRILVAYLKPMYVLPSYRLSLNWVNVLVGGAVVLLCTGGVSFMTCRKFMEESPAELLRDKPPAKGIHVFLERFPETWDRLRFRTKLIFRNTLRNKSRMFMAVLGVTGCAGLIIAAFTLRGMIQDITRVTYGQVYTYDHKAVLDADTTRQDVYNLHLDGVVQPILETAMQTVSDAGVRKMVGVTVFEEGNELVNLHTYEGEPVTLPKEGVVLSRKMAESLQVNVGDTLSLKRHDDSYVDVTVENIVYMVAAQGIYMSRSAWEGIRETFDPTAIFIKWNGDADTGFLNSSYVEKWVEIGQQRSDFEENLTIVDISVLIMIIAGGVLAFVVLYNMGNLNFFERTRDLATLKVLGFQEKEIRALVLVENVISVIGGILAGIPVGKLLSVILADGFGEDLDLLPVLTLKNIAVAAALTIVFALFVNRVVAKKMRRLDMLQALKSVE